MARDRIADRNTERQSNAFKPLYRASSLILDVGAALPHPRKHAARSRRKCHAEIYGPGVLYRIAEGLKGLQKDKASGRRTAVSKAAEALGGKLEALYYAFGEDDAVAILDLPDNVSASALSLAVSASGVVRTKTTPLLTVDETDQALQKSANYRAPGG